MRGFIDNNYISTSSSGGLREKNKLDDETLNFSLSLSLGLLYVFRYINIQFPFKEKCAN